MMNCKINSNVPFITLLESIFEPKCDLLFEEHEERLSDNDCGMLCRGRSKTRKELELQILKKRKRDSLVQNIELLRNLIQEKNEEESLIQLTKIINQVTTPDQKSLIISHLTKSENDSHYIPTRTISWQSTKDHENLDSECIIARSTAPEVGADVSLTSINTNSSFNSIQSPKSSPGEQYLIYKGIYYCRVLLSKGYHEKDNTIIKELKSRDILNYVLNEQMQNDKSYLMILVERYPSSYAEILFLLKEDEGSILGSPIFVLFAEKNMNQLYDFLIKLTNDKLDKNKLSQTCDNSSFHGVCVSDIIKRNKNPDQIVSGVKIETFLSRYKKQQIF